MQVNPEDHPQDIYITWSNPRMTDFENTFLKYTAEPNYYYKIHTLEKTIMVFWRL